MARRNAKFPKLKIPFYDDGSNDEGHYKVNTVEEKTVCDYTGFNFSDLDDMCVFEYWLLLHDAVIYGHMQTKEGKEYLNNCWRITQTSPDRSAIRKKMGRKGG